MSEARVLEMPTIVRRVGDGTTIEQVDEFLDIIIPEAMINGEVIVKKLDRNDIESLILDRSPFLCVDKAVILQTGNQHRIIASSVVTKEMCDGHFSIRTMVPLLIFSKVMALTGSILLSWLYHEESPVPLAVKAEGVHSTTRDLVTPPALAVAEATLLRRKFQFCWVNTAVWVGNKKVGEMSKLGFVLASESFLLES